MGKELSEMTLEELWELFPIFLVHLRYTGDNDELYLRDYLNELPDVAKEYETLNLRLWKQYEHNRDAYTDAKTGFISKWTAEVLCEGMEYESLPGKLAEKGGRYHEAQGSVL